MTRSGKILTAILLVTVLMLMTGVLVACGEKTGKQDDHLPFVPASPAVSDSKQAAESEPGAIRTRLSAADAQALLFDTIVNTQKGAEDGDKLTFSLSPYFMSKDNGVDKKYTIRMQGSIDFKDTDNKNNLTLFEVLGENSALPGEAQDEMSKNGNVILGVYGIDGDMYIDWRNYETGGMVNRYKVSDMNLAFVMKALDDVLDRLDMEGLLNKFSIADMIEFPDEMKTFEGPINNLVNLKGTLIELLLSLIDDGGYMINTGANSRRLVLPCKITSILNLIGNENIVNMLMGLLGGLLDPDGTAGLGDMLGGLVDALLGRYIHGTTNVMVTVDIANDTFEKAAVTAKITSKDATESTFEIGFGELSFSKDEQFAAKLRERIKSFDFQQQDRKKYSFTTLSADVALKLNLEKHTYTIGKIDSVLGNAIANMLGGVTGETWKKAAEEEIEISTPVEIDLHVRIRAEIDLRNNENTMIAVEILGYQDQLRLGLYYKGDDSTHGALYVDMSGMGGGRVKVSRYDAFGPEPDGKYMMDKDGKYRPWKPSDGDVQRYGKHDNDLNINYMLVEALETYIPEIPSILELVNGGGNAAAAEGVSDEYARNVEKAAELIHSGKVVVDRFLGADPETAAVSESDASGTVDVMGLITGIIGSAEFVSGGAPMMLKALIADLSKDTIDTLVGALGVDLPISKLKLELITSTDGDYQNGMPMPEEGLAIKAGIEIGKDMPDPDNPDADPKYEKFIGADLIVYLNYGHPDVKFREEIFNHIPFSKFIDIDFFRMNESGELDNMVIGAALQARLKLKLAETMPDLSPLGELLGGLSLQLKSDETDEHDGVYIDFGLDVKANLNLMTLIGLIQGTAPIEDLLTTLEARIEVTRYMSDDDETGKPALLAYIGDGVLYLYSPGLAIGKYKVNLADALGGGFELFAKDTSAAAAYVVEDDEAAPQPDFLGILLASLAEVNVSNSALEIGLAADFLGKILEPMGLGFEPGEITNEGTRISIKLDGLNLSELWLDADVELQQQIDESRKAGIGLGLGLGHIRLDIGGLQKDGEFEDFGADIRNDPGYADILNGGNVFLGLQLEIAAYLKEETISLDNMLGALLADASAFLDTEIDVSETVDGSFYVTVMADADLCSAPEWNDTRLLIEIRKRHTKEDGSAGDKLLVGIYYDAAEDVLYLDCDGETFRPVALKNVGLIKLLGDLIGGAAGSSATATAAAPDLSGFNPVIVIGNKGIQIELLSGVTQLLIGLLAGDFADTVDVEHGWKYHESGSASDEVLEAAEKDAAGKPVLYQKDVAKYVLGEDGEFVKAADGEGGILYAHFKDGVYEKVYEPNPTEGESFEGIPEERLSQAVGTADGKHYKEYATTDGVKYVEITDANREQYKSCAHYAKFLYREITLLEKGDTTAEGYGLLGWVKKYSDAGLPAYVKTDASEEDVNLAKVYAGGSYTRADGSEISLNIPELGAKIQIGSIDPGYLHGGQHDTSINGLGIGLVFSPKATAGNPDPAPCAGLAIKVGNIRLDKNRKKNPILIGEDRLTFDQYFDYLEGRTKDSCDPDERIPVADLEDITGLTVYLNLDAKIEIGAKTTDTAQDDHSATDNWKLGSMLSGLLGEQPAEGGTDALMEFVKKLLLKFNIEAPVYTALTLHVSGNVNIGALLGGGDQNENIVKMLENSDLAVELGLGRERIRLYLEKDPDGVSWVYVDADCTLITDTKLKLPFSTIAGMILTPAAASATAGEAAPAPDAAGIIRMIDDLIGPGGVRIDRDSLYVNLGAGFLTAILSLAAGVEGIDLPLAEEKSFLEINVGPAYSESEFGEYVAKDVVYSKASGTEPKGTAMFVRKDDYVPVPENEPEETKRYVMNYKYVPEAENPEAVGQRYVKDYSYTPKNSEASYPDGTVFYVKDGDAYRPETAEDPAEWPRYLKSETGGYVPATGTEPEGTEKFLHLPDGTYSEALANVPEGTALFVKTDRYDPAAGTEPLDELYVRNNVYEKATGDEPEGTKKYEKTVGYFLTLGLGIDPVWLTVSLGKLQIGLSRNEEVFGVEKGPDGNRKAVHLYEDAYDKTANPDGFKTFKDFADNLSLAAEIGIDLELNEGPLSIGEIITAVLQATGTNIDIPIALDVQEDMKLHLRIQIAGNVNLNDVNKSQLKLAILDEAREGTERDTFLGLYFDYDYDKNMPVLYVENHFAFRGGKYKVEDFDLLGSALGDAAKALVDMMGGTGKEEASASAADGEGAEVLFDLSGEAIRLEICRELLTGLLNSIIPEDSPEIRKMLEDLGLEAALEIDLPTYDEEGNPKPDSQPGLRLDVGSSSIGLAVLIKQLEISLSKMDGIFEGIDFATFVEKETPGAREALGVELGLRIDYDLGDGRYALDGILSDLSTAGFALDETGNVSTIGNLLKIITADAIVETVRGYIGLTVKLNVLSAEMAQYLPAAGKALADLVSGSLGGQAAPGGEGFDPLSLLNMLEAAIILDLNGRPVWISLVQEGGKGYLYFTLSGVGGKNFKIPLETFIKGLENIPAAGTAVATAEEAAPPADNTLINVILNKAFASISIADADGIDVALGSGFLSYLMSTLVANLIGEGFAFSEGVENLFVLKSPYVKADSLGSEKPMDDRFYVRTDIVRDVYLADYLPGDDAFETPFAQPVVGDLWFDPDGKGPEEMRAAVRGDGALYYEKAGAYVKLAAPDGKYYDDAHNLIADSASFEGEMFVKLGEDVFAPAADDAGEFPAFYVEGTKAYGVRIDAAGKLKYRAGTEKDLGPAYTKAGDVYAKTDGVQSLFAKDGASAAPVPEGTALYMRISHDRYTTAPLFYEEGGEYKRFADAASVYAAFDAGTSVFLLREGKGDYAPAPADPAEGTALYVKEYSFAEKDASATYPDGTVFYVKDGDAYRPETDEDPAETTRYVKSWTGGYVPAAGDEPEGTELFVRTDYAAVTAAELYRKVEHSGVFLTKKGIFINLMFASDGAGHPGFFLKLGVSPVLSFSGDAVSVLPEGSDPATYGEETGAGNISVSLTVDIEAEGGGAESETNLLGLLKKLLTMLVPEGEPSPLSEAELNALDGLGGLVLGVGESRLAKASLKISVSADLGKLITQISAVPVDVAGLLQSLELAIELLDDDDYTEVLGGIYLYNGNLYIDYENPAKNPFVMNLSGLLDALAPAQSCASAAEGRTLADPALLQLWLGEYVGFKGAISTGLSVKLTTALVDKLLNALLGVPEGLISDTFRNLSAEVEICLGWPDLAMRDGKVYYRFGEEYKEVATCFREYVIGEDDVRYARRSADGPYFQPVDDNFYYLEDSKYKRAGSDLPAGTQLYVSMGGGVYEMCDGKWYGAHEEYSAGPFRPYEDGDGDRYAKLSGDGAYVKPAAETFYVKNADGSFGTPPESLPEGTQLYVKLADGNCAECDGKWYGAAHGYDPAYPGERVIEYVKNPDVTTENPASEDNPEYIRRPLFFSQDAFAISIGLKVADLAFSLTIGHISLESVQVIPDELKELPVPEESVLELGLDVELGVIFLEQEPKYVECGADEPGDKFVITGGTPEEPVYAPYDPVAHAGQQTYKLQRCFDLGSFLDGLGLIPGMSLANMLNVEIPEGGAGIRLTIALAVALNLSEIDHTGAEIKILGQIVGYDGGVEKYEVTELAAAYLKNGELLLKLDGLGFGKAKISGLALSKLLGSHNILDLLAAPAASERSAAVAAELVERDNIALLLNPDGLAIEVGKKAVEWALRLGALGMNSLTYSECAPEYDGQRFAKAGEDYVVSVDGKFYVGNSGYVPAPDPLPDPAPALFVKNADGTYSSAPDPLPDPAPALFVKGTVCEPAPAQVAEGTQLYVKDAKDGEFRACDGKWYKLDNAYVGCDVSDDCVKYVAAGPADPDPENPLYVPYDEDSVDHCGKTFYAKSADGRYFECKADCAEKYVYLGETETKVYLLYDPAAHPAGVETYKTTTTADTISSIGIDALVEIVTDGKFAINVKATAAGLLGITVSIKHVQIGTTGDRPGIKATVGERLDDVDETDYPEIMRLNFWHDENGQLANSMDIVLETLALSVQLDITADFHQGMYIGQTPEGADYPTAIVGSRSPEGDSAKPWSTKGITLLVNLEVHLAGLISLIDGGIDTNDVYTLVSKALPLINAQISMISAAGREILSLYVMNGNVYAVLDGLGFPNLVVTSDFLLEIIKAAMPASSGSAEAAAVSPDPVGISVILGKLLGGVTLAEKALQVSLANDYFSGLLDTLLFRGMPYYGKVLPDDGKKPNLDFSGIKINLGKLVDNSEKDILKQKREGLLQVDLELVGTHLNVDLMMPVISVNRSIINDNSYGKNFHDRQFKAADEVNGATLALALQIKINRNDGVALGNILKSVVGDLGTALVIKDDIDLRLRVKASLKFSYDLDTLAFALDDIGAEILIGRYFADLDKVVPCAVITYNSEDRALYLDISHFMGAQDPDGSRNLGKLKITGIDLMGLLGDLLAGAVSSATAAAPADYREDPWVYDEDGNPLKIFVPADSKNTAPPPKYKKVDDDGYTLYRPLAREKIWVKDGAGFTEFKKLLHADRECWALIDGEYRELYVSVDGDYVRYMKGNPDHNGLDTYTYGPVYEYLNYKIVPGIKLYVEDSSGTDGYREYNPATDKDRICFVRTTGNLFHSGADYRQIYVAEGGRYAGYKAGDESYRYKAKYLRRPHSSFVIPVNDKFYKKNSDGSFAETTSTDGEVYVMTAEERYEEASGAEPAGTALFVNTGTPEAPVYAPYDETAHAGMKTYVLAAPRYEKCTESRAANSYVKAYDPVSLAYCYLLEDKYVPVSDGATYGRVQVGDGELFVKVGDEVKPYVKGMDGAQACLENGADLYRYDFATGTYSLYKVSATGGRPGQLFARFNGDDGSAPDTTPRYLAADVDGEEIFLRHSDYAVYIDRPLLYEYDEATGMYNVSADQTSITDETGGYKYILADIYGQSIVWADVMTQDLLFVSITGKSMMGLVAQMLADQSDEEKAIVGNMLDNLFVKLTGKTNPLKLEIGVDLLDPYNHNASAFGLTIGLYGFDHGPDRFGSMLSFEYTKLVPEDSDDFRVLADLDLTKLLAAADPMGSLFSFLNLGDKRDPVTDGKLFLNASITLDTLVNSSETVSWADHMAGFFGLTPDEISVFYDIFYTEDSADGVRGGVTIDLSVAADAEKLIGGLLSGGNLDLEGTEIQLAIGVDSVLFTPDLRRNKNGTGGGKIVVSVIGKDEDGLTGVYLDFSQFRNGGMHRMSIDLAGLIGGAASRAAEAETGIIGSAEGGQQIWEALNALLGEVRFENGKISVGLSKSFIGGLFNTLAGMNLDKNAATIISGDVSVDVRNLGVEVNLWLGDKASNELYIGIGVGRINLSPTDDYRRNGGTFVKEADRKSRFGDINDMQLDLDLEASLFYNGKMPDPHEPLDLAPLLDLVGALMGGKPLFENPDMTVVLGEDLDADYTLGVHAHLDFSNFDNLRIVANINRKTKSSPASGNVMGPLSIGAYLDAHDLYLDLDGMALPRMKLTGINLGDVLDDALGGLLESIGARRPGASAASCLYTDNNPVDGGPYGEYWGEHILAPESWGAGAKPFFAVMAGQYHFGLSFNAVMLNALLEAISPIIGTSIQLPDFGAMAITVDGNHKPVDENGNPDRVERLKTEIVFQINDNFYVGIRIGKLTLQTEKTTGYRSKAMELFNAMDFSQFEDVVDIGTGEITMERINAGLELEIGAGGSDTSVTSATAGSFENYLGELLKLLLGADLPIEFNTAKTGIGYKLVLRASLSVKSLMETLNGQAGEVDRWWKDIELFLSVEPKGYEGKYILKLFKKRNDADVFADLSGMSLFKVKIIGLGGLIGGAMSSSASAAGEGAKAAAGEGTPAKLKITLYADGMKLEVGMGAVNGILALLGGGMVIGNQGCYIDEKTLQVNTAAAGDPPALETYKPLNDDGTPNAAHAGLQFHQGGEPLYVEKDGDYTEYLSRTDLDTEPPQEYLPKYKKSGTSFVQITTPSGFTTISLAGAGGAATTIPLPVLSDDNALALHLTYATNLELSLGLGLDNFGDSLSLAINNLHLSLGDNNYVRYGSEKGRLKTGSGEGAFEEIAGDREKSFSGLILNDGLGMSLGNILAGVVGGIDPNLTIYWNKNVKYNWSEKKEWDTTKQDRDSPNYSTIQLKRTTAGSKNSADKKVGAGKLEATVTVTGDDINAGTGAAVAHQRQIKVWLCNNFIYADLGGIAALLHNLGPLIGALGMQLDYMMLAELNILDMLGGLGGAASASVASAAAEETGEEPAPAAGLDIMSLLKGVEVNWWYNVADPDHPYGGKDNSSLRVNLNAEGFNGLLYGLYYMIYGLCKPDASPTQEEFAALPVNVQRDIVVGNVGTTTTYNGKTYNCVNAYKTIVMYLQHFLAVMLGDMTGQAMLKDALDVGPSALIAGIAGQLTTILPDIIGSLLPLPLLDPARPSYLEVLLDKSLIGTDRGVIKEIGVYLNKEKMQTGTVNRSKVGDWSESAEIIIEFTEAVDLRSVTNVTNYDSNSTPPQSLNKTIRVADAFNPVELSSGALKGDSRLIQRVRATFHNISEYDSKECHSAPNAPGCSGELGGTPVLWDTSTVSLIPGAESEMWAYALNYRFQKVKVKVSEITAFSRLYGYIDPSGKFIQTGRIVIDPTRDPVSAGPPYTLAALPEIIIIMRKDGELQMLDVKGPGSTVYDVEGTEMSPIGKFAWFTPSAADVEEGGLVNVEFWYQALHSSRIRKSMNVLYNNSKIKEVHLDASDPRYDILTGGHTANDFTPANLDVLGNLGLVDLAASTVEKAPDGSAHDAEAVYRDGSRIIFKKDAADTDADHAAGLSGTFERSFGGKLLQTGRYAYVPGEPPAAAGGLLGGIFAGDAGTVDEDKDYGTYRISDVKNPDGTPAGVRRLSVTLANGLTSSVGVVGWNYDGFSYSMNSPEKGAVGTVTVYLDRYDASGANVTQSATIDVNVEMYKMDTLIDGNLPMNQYEDLFVKADNGMYDLRTVVTGEYVAYDPDDPLYAGVTEFFKIKLNEDGTASDPAVYEAYTHEDEVAKTDKFVLRRVAGYVSVETGGKYNSRFFPDGETGIRIKSHRYTSREETFDEKDLVFHTDTVIDRDGNAVRMFVVPSLVASSVKTLEVTAVYENKGGAYKQSFDFKMLYTDKKVDKVVVYMDNGSAVSGIRTARVYFTDGTNTDGIAVKDIVTDGVTGIKDGKLDMIGTIYTTATIGRIEGKDETGADVWNEGFTQVGVPVEIRSRSR